MDFTLLDYHILTLLSGQSCATEHVFKSQLHEHINNRKHLLYRINRLVGAGLVRVSNGVVYSIGELGRILIGKVEPTAEQKKLILDKGLPHRLTQDHIRKQLAPSKPQKKTAPRENTTEKTFAEAVCGTPASKKATQQLTALLTGLKTQSSQEGPHRHSKMTVVPAALPAAPSARRKSTSMAMARIPTNNIPSPPVEKHITPVDIREKKCPLLAASKKKGNTQMELTDVKNADIFCLTPDERRAVSIINEMQPVTPARVSEMLSMDGYKEGKKVTRHLLQRGLIHQGRGGKLSVSDKQAIDLGLGANPKREHHETQIFSLTRAERIIIESAMKHKQQMIPAREAAGLLHRCGEKNTDVKALLASLEDKQVAKKHKNNARYLTTVFILAAGMRPYSATRRAHIDAIKDFPNPDALAFLTEQPLATPSEKPASEPSATKVAQPAAASARQKTEKRPEAQTSPVATDPDSGPSQNSEKQTESAKQPPVTSVYDTTNQAPTASKAMSETTIYSNIQAEMDMLSQKLNAPDVTIENKSEKISFLKSLAGMVPESMEDSRGLLLGIAEDLSKLS